MRLEDKLRYVDALARQYRNIPDDSGMTNWDRFRLAVARQAIRNRVRSIAGRHDEVWWRFVNRID